MFKAVIDSNGKPVYIGKNENRLNAEASKAGQFLVESAPPRNRDRKWMWDGQAWLVDANAEQAERNALDERQSRQDAAKAAMAENQSILDSSPTFNAATLQTLHNNILIMMRGISSLD